MRRVFSLSLIKSQSVRRVGFRTHGLLAGAFRQYASSTLRERRLRNVVLGAVVGGAGGCFAIKKLWDSSYGFLLIPPKTDQTQQQLQRHSLRHTLLNFNNHIYETTDNICIFVLPSENEMRKRYHEIKSFIQDIEKMHLPVTLTFAYTVREFTELEAKTTGIPITLCKGHRQKSFVGVSNPKTPKQLAEFSVQEVAFRQFFTPVSEKLTVNNEKEVSSKSPFIEPTSYDTFQKDVVEASKTQPILVQATENSCFLCFLIKPFMISVAETLKQNNVNVCIKQINLDLNDFPSHFPVLRSTPNFLLYDSNNKGSEEGVKYDLWTEHKPVNIVEKLTKEFSLSHKVVTELETAVTKLDERLKQFGLLLLWMGELHDLQQFHLEGKLPLDKAKAKENNTDSLSRHTKDIINTLIEEELKRNDSLDESLEYANQRIESTKKDCIVLAKVLGKKFESPECLKEFQLTRKALIQEI